MARVGPGYDWGERSERWSGVISQVADIGGVRVHYLRSDAAGAPRDAPRPGDPAARLAAVLEPYALSADARRGGHDPELAVLLHRDEQVIAARHRLRQVVARLIAEAAGRGAVRDDVSPEGLAAYALAALSAASGLSSEAAVRRLLRVILAGLRP